MDDPWDSYRLRRSRFILCLFAAPILGLAGFVIGLVIGGQNADILGTVVVGIGVLAFAVSGMALTLWPCPRCRLPFFCSWWMSNHFASRCMHCKLQKWAKHEN